MERERRTVSLMVALYCGCQHRPRVNGLCPACRELLDYALLRLDRCRYQGAKTTCARCPTHCYKPEMRERIREVMRYAGPRMLLRHPLAAVWHFLDRLRRSSP